MFLINTTIHKTSVSDSHNSHNGITHLHAVLNYCALKKVSSISQYYFNGIKFHNEYIESW